MRIESDTGQIKRISRTWLCFHWLYIGVLGSDSQTEEFNIHTHIHTYTHIYSIERIAQQQTSINNKGDDVSRD